MLDNSESIKHVRRDNVIYLTRDELMSSPDEVMTAFQTSQLLQELRKSAKASSKEKIYIQIQM